MAKSEAIESRAAKCNAETPANHVDTDAGEIVEGGEVVASVEGETLLMVGTLPGSGTGVLLCDDCAAEAETDAERVEDEAQTEATRVLEGSDPEAGDWRAAGYATAEAAARVLVGEHPDKAVAARAVEIVAERLGVARG